MIIRSEKKQQQHGASETNYADQSSEFKTPEAYLRGERKYLNSFHNGDWWLNVNYVTSEAAAH